MKTNFDIDSYLRKVEAGFSSLDDIGYYMGDGAYGYIGEEIEPPFNRKRILLLLR